MNVSIKHGSTEEMLELGSALIRRALQRIREKGYENSFEYMEEGQTVICTYSLLLNDTL